MSCPTCDHTMQNVAPELFWCLRCGTLRDRAHENDSTSMLVNRVANLFAVIKDECHKTIPQVVDYARVIGIFESVRKE